MKTKGRLLLIVFVVLAAVVAHAENLKQATGLTCPGYNYEGGDKSIADLNPQAQAVGNVQFPLTDDTLYRGIVQYNPQFGPVRVLAALFGEKDWFAGSPMFWTIARLLKGEIQLKTPMLPVAGFDLPVEAYLGKRHILHDVKTLLDCLPDAGANDRQANLLAADLMNKMFRRFGPDKTAQIYLNMKNPLYYDDTQNEYGFGNHTADVVATSALEIVSASYGRKVAILRDIHHRAVDLNLYNYAVNGFLADAWMDYGEVDFPGYVKGDELIGYQEHVNDRQRPGHALIHSPLEYELMKHVENHMTYILALEGGPECVVKGDDNRFYMCNDYGDQIVSNFTPIPVPMSTRFRYRVGLMGVFALCKQTKGHPCVAPTNIFKWYGKYSDSKLDAHLIDHAEKLQINGESVKYFPFDHKVADGDSSREQKPKAKRNHSRWHKRHS